MVMKSNFLAGAVAALALCLVVPVAEAAQRGGNIAGGVQGGYVGGGAMRGGGVGGFSGGGMRAAPSMSAPRAMAPVGGGPRVYNRSYSPGTTSSFPKIVTKPGRGAWKGDPGVRPGKWTGGHGYKHRHHRRHVRFYGYPYFYNYDDGYYRSGGCGWLWQRYLITGNPKWKYRYYDCID
jgi:hypothetical protein